MSDVLESKNPGWRPDPSGRYEWRYWDEGWTNRVANSAPAGTASPSVPPELTGATTAPAAPTDHDTGTPPIAVATEPDPEPQHEPEITDPFAVLRVPRGATPTADEPTTATSAPAPIFAPSIAASAPTSPVPTAAPSLMVPTPATRHDGTTGTVWDAPYVAPGTPPEPDSDERRGGRSGGGVLGFIRSFWEQPESYHSDKAGIELPPHPNHSQLEQPANYARAGLVMLAACGVAIGAYLPWISGTIGVAEFERTGYQLGNAWGFTWVAASFAVAALCATRRKVMGWVTMGLAVVVAGLVARQLLDVHDQVQGLNRAMTVEANVGVGLWIMLASAAIGLVAAFRFDGSEEIV